MDDEGKVLRVEDPVELAQGGVQRHLLERVVRRLLNWVVRHHLALINVEDVEMVVDNQIK